LNDKISRDIWPTSIHRHSSIDDDGRCDVESSIEDDPDRKTPTNFVVDENFFENAFSVNGRFRDNSSLPEYRRTSSLVDELLNEIYARFGEMSSKNSISG
jgi:hypothetical protein